MVTQNGVSAPPTAKEEVITPELAEYYLGKARPNRVLNPTRARRLADDMERGRWQVNGQTIVFDDQGQLIDGQAVVLSRTPITTHVVRGVSRDALLTIDTAPAPGRSRTPGDSLSVVSPGLTNVNVRAAVGRLLYVYDKFDGRLDVTGPSGQPTRSELMETLGRHPDLDESIAVSEKVRKLGHGMSLWTALHYLFARRDWEAAYRFFDMLASGTGLNIDDPVYRLRERLLNRGSRVSDRLTSQEVAALSIKAWNAYRQGRKMRILLWRKEQEPFPVIT